ncbi:uncharacterized protein LOC101222016 [Cucumis sativus]|uniref:Uncharacterized protein n=1 Tax=Cucumis sativus TaxID=3659 RepID=A0A0A0LU66_CUCSA|nr:uncharacterized protein LOC101222016 [Cucumis sativus]XP_011656907.1 uncharacterized protein LOC101222016 [Cucumis sativus]XP_031736293.1 uncharacterized protein LOC101222016 [Cucumis sativus]
MGTRLEPTFNPLATSAHISSSSSSSSNNNTLFTIQRLNAWQHHFQDSTTATRFPLKLIYNNTSSPMTTTGSLDKFQEAINKMLQKGDVDAIRKTMQDHEDAFKNQVKELHRLYSVQKMLMEELRKESKQNALWCPKAMNHLLFNNRENQNQTAQTTGGGLIFNLQSLRSDDPSSRERSGSCSGDNMRIISRGFDLERPAAEEDMSTGVSTVDEDQAGPSTPIVVGKMSIDGCEDEESDVELTLSIGGSLSKKRSKSFPPLTQKKREIDSSLSFKSERGDQECSDPTTPMSSSSATCDQETKRPHWLFQSLKLK